MEWSGLECSGVGWSRVEQIRALHSELRGPRSLTCEEFHFIRVHFVDAACFLIEMMNVD